MASFAADGRQSFHGKNEVFSSNHFDRVMVETVDSKVWRVREKNEMEKGAG